MHIMNVFVLDLKPTTHAPYLFTKFLILDLYNSSKITTVSICFTQRNVLSGQVDKFAILA